ncbi:MFS transporter, partial [Streptococcus equi]
MEDKLFNKHFIGITVLNFIVYMVYYLFTVIIAFVATKELGAKTSEAGLATGIYILGTLLARLIFGKQLEVLGRRLVLRGGAIFYLLTTLAYFFMPTIGMMYLVRLLNGFGYGVVSTATNTIVTAYIPARKRGEGINFYGLSTSLAAAIGPFVGTFMLDNLHIDFRLIIVLCSVLIAVVVAGAFAFPVTNISLNSE